jgi:hypothetical protein
MKLLLIFLCLALTACGTTTGLSPEQIKAMDGQSSSICVRAPGWNGSPLEIHYVSFGGKSTGTAGGGGKASCGTSVAQFENEGRAMPASRPASGAQP